MLLLAVGGCATAGEDDIIPTAPDIRRAAQPASNPRRELLGHSVLGRAIEIEHFGDGKSPVLILGGIHGDEVTSVDLTRNLIVLLRARPELTAGHAVSIIEIANPDGYAKRTRTNSRGIDVNRNFPASNFRAGGGTGFRGGSAPASEPETRAVLSAIAQLRPRLIISIHSIRGGRQCNNYDGPAEPFARAMSRHNGYPVTASIGYPTPGSLGSYAGIDLKIPIVTLELPRDLPGERAWQQNWQALLAGISATSAGR